jgi:hypothetical protein
VALEALQGDRESQRSFEVRSMELLRDQDLVRVATQWRQKMEQILEFPIS